MVGCVMVVVKRVVFKEKYPVAEQVKRRSVWMKD